MNSKKVRQTFIAFFEKKNHQFVTSSSVVNDGDPTLMFTNAGMNQFKDVFLGIGKRPYTRAVNSQVCVRVSGKHNDLEDVGKDNTHLTSFEMLGNWSFGDYYKKEAITWAWELFTEVFKIPKSHLYATVFEDDSESFNLWKTETDIDQAHIVKCDEKDNFWEMGKTGPCGPCSEIHVDLRPDADNEQVVDQALLDTDRFTELWNLVFIQYNREENGDLVSLPQTHVDTGAGLERLVSYLNGTYSNYQTDLFLPILEKIEQLTGVAYTDSIAGMPHRVLADHCRTLVFGIADNALPSNEGKGYVLRRLLRRALRYAQKLDVKEPIIYKLVDTVVEILGDYLGHLKERQDFIKTIIKSEEESFLKTLEQGLALFNNLADSLKKKNQDTIPGIEAFKLYDTYGFPLDLTQVLAEEQQFKVDLVGFEELLNKQRSQSRESTLKKQKIDMKDSGELINNDRFENLNLHLSEYVNEARGGEARVIKIPKEKIEMARHHTATHLLHQALRDILGDHVQQAGSLVDSNRLRFDFTHYSSISDEDLTKIEKIVNQKIQEAQEITAEYMTLDEAKQQGAMALFGEKYDSDNVRLIGIGAYSKELCGGTHVKNTSDIQAFKIIQESAVAAGTRRIEAIAGQELIENYDRSEKDKRIKLIEKKLQKLKTLKAEASIPNAYNNLNTRDVLALDILLVKLTQDIKIAEKNYSESQEKEASTKIKDLLNKTIVINTFKVCASMIEADMATLKTLADQLTHADSNLIAILAGNGNNKGCYVVKIGKDVQVIKAPEIIQFLTNISGGKGGGKPDFAQAGGADSNLLEEALSRVPAFFKND